MSKGKDPVTGKRLTLNERIVHEIADYRRDAQLDSWTSFVEELKVPGDLAPALMTGRAELLAIVQPRALTVDECAVLYKLFGGLLKTNTALRHHAERVAQLTDILNNSLKGALTAARSIDDFANFRVPEEDEDDVAA